MQNMNASQNYNGNCNRNHHHFCNQTRNQNSNSNNRNSNCNCSMEQKNLKRYIDLVSFAALDCAIFLDTHPSNSEALEYFEYYKNARKQALKEYSSRFSPLTLDTVPKDTTFWAWANEPWPWEMEG
nr:spore coat protein CotJB [uncultured Anaerobutyricum sp.]